MILRPGNGDSNGVHSPELMDSADGRGLITDRGACTGYRAPVLASGHFEGAMEDDEMIAQARASQQDLNFQRSCRELKDFSGERALCNGSHARVG